MTVARCPRCGRELLDPSGRPHDVVVEIHQRLGTCEPVGAGEPGEES